MRSILRKTFAAVVVLCACNDSTGGDGDAIVAMRFVTLPATVEATEPFAVAIEVLGRDGERSFSFSDSVHVSLVGTGTLTGTTSAVPIDGVAMFPDLRVSTASDALQLVVSAGGITAGSPSFRATDNCTPSVVVFPVSVAGSLAGALCEIDGRATAQFRFTNTTLRTVQFSATSTDASFSPELAVINEPPSDFIPVTTGPTATGYWLLPPAMYRLRVASALGVPGPFSIVTSTSPAFGCNPRTLLPFALFTYPESIDGNDCIGSETARNDRFWIYSPNPCSITMRSVQATFDAFLTIRNAYTRELLAEDDNSGGGVAARDAFVSLTECRSGTAPIEIVATVSNVAAQPAGAYTLMLQITGGVSLFAIGPGATR